MRRLARNMQALLAAHTANVLQYRAEMVLWAISGALPLILAGIWYEAAATNPGAFGFGPNRLVIYFFCTFVVRQMTLVWVVWEFEYQVVEGTLSHYLLQPIDPAWRYIAAHLAERLVRVPVILILGAAFFGLFPEALMSWRISPGTFALAVLAIAGTFILRFAVQYAFGMLAFWTERAHSVEQLWYLPYLYVSGLVVPLNEMPAGLREVLMWTPFPYLIGWPAEILMGRPHDLGRGFAIMACWTVVFLVTQRVLWWAGLRKYSAMGA